jgi:hypothetical protein
MTDTFENALPWPQSKKTRTTSTAAETTPGGKEATRWVKIAQNLNPGEAMVIKGRLESHDIPTVIQQEALGSVLGLTVGPLGSANLLVPEPLADRALEILEETFDEDDEFWPDEEDFPVEE